MLYSHYCISPLAASPPDLLSATAVLFTALMNGPTLWFLVGSHLKRRSIFTWWGFAWRWNRSLSWTAAGFGRLFTFVVSRWALTFAGLLWAGFGWIVAGMMSCMHLEPSIFKHENLAAYNYSPIAKSGLSLSYLRHFPNPHSLFQTILLHTFLSKRAL